MIIRALTLLFILAGTCIAQEQSRLEPADTMSGEKTTNMQEKKEAGEQVLWPQPFNPSQEIGADSQVSFPTDI